MSLVLSWERFVLVYAQFVSKNKGYHKGTHQPNAVRERRGTSATAPPTRPEVERNPCQRPKPRLTYKVRRNLRDYYDADQKKEREYC